jgi:predicted  nucleic acid-binding Zn-ribbon protein
MFVENSIQDKLDAVIKLNTQLNELNSQLPNLNIQKQKIVNDISDIKLSISDLLKKIEYIDSSK